MHHLSFVGGSYTTKYPSSLRDNVSFVIESLPEPGGSGPRMAMFLGCFLGFLDNFWIFGLLDFWISGFLDFFHPFIQELLEKIRKNLEWGWMSCSRPSLFEFSGLWIEKKHRGERNSIPENWALESGKPGISGGKPCRLSSGNLLHNYWKWPLK